MNKSNQPLAILLATLCGAAQASVTADEARRLGATLTSWGAEAAGNATGTIPAYAGGLTKPPAGWSKDKPGVRPDPFASDKLRLSITRANLAEHAEHVTPGFQALLKKYPTFRLDVYPTRRTVAYPKEFLDASVKNATRCRLVDDGLGIQDCHGGIPFPIPKNGHEAMWNTILRYSGPSVLLDGVGNWYVDGAGRATHTATFTAHLSYPNYAPDGNPHNVAWQAQSHYTAPARTSGEAILVLDPLNNATDKPRVYQYIPGQRRVKLAPNLAYDTPAPNTAGLVTIDSTPTFRGPMDRFNFKLVGKREIFMPYNVYKMSAGGDAANCSPEKFLTPNHWNPDCVRFELHRVWVVEATLKTGKRHVFPKRVYYINEDAANATLTDNYDASNQVQRVGFTLYRMMYEVPTPFADGHGAIDLDRGGWQMQSYDWPGTRGVVPVLKPDVNFTPEGLAGTGVR